MFKKWWRKAWPGKRAAHARWAEGLAWFRLRYLTSEGPTRCIKLLSRAQACGRVALYFQPDEAVSELYLGVPGAHVRLLQQMADDFGFLLSSLASAPAIHATNRLSPAAQLPWDHSFTAHIVNEAAFVHVIENNAITTVAHREMPAWTVPLPGGEWSLPGNPPPGLSMQPQWSKQSPPAAWIASEPRPRSWPLGWARSGDALQISGRLNVYGQQKATADWLGQLVMQQIKLNPTRLVVIDGANALVPRLKRKATVTRLLGSQLAYIDIDGAFPTSGFNPLALVPGETEAAMVRRWQQWFGGMNVHPQGLRLLADARQDGVGNLPGLRKWLKQQARQGHNTAVSSLEVALSRLTASRMIREWLEWPTNRFEGLPHGALFFACKQNSWARQQLIRAILLGAMQIPDVRIILNGFSCKDITDRSTGLPAQFILSNGPLLPDALPVIVTCSSSSAAILGKRFFGSDPAQIEMLQLLCSGESLVVSPFGPVKISWDPPKAESSAAIC